MKILNLILKIVSFVCMVLLLLTALNGYIAPEHAGLLAVLALATPVLVLANVLLAAYWIILWNRTAVWMLLALLLCSGHVSRHFRFRMRKEVAAEKPDLRIMTYNVGIFRLWGGEYRNSADSILGVIGRYNPDILFMQEFRTTKEQDLAYMNDRLSNLRYRYVRYFSITDKTSREYGSGLAIYSRYKLIDGHEVRFEDSPNGAIYADMVIRKDTVRLFNLHLQTASLTMREVYELNDIDDVAQAKNIVRKLLKNNNKRAQQADRIAELVAESPYRSIVCGDFNDTPASYTYRKVRGGKTDAFVAAGRGLGYTFNTVLPILRIDNVFVDGDKYKVTGYESPDLPFSDHNPVIVELELKQK